MNFIVEMSTRGIYIERVRGQSRASSLLLEGQCEKLIAEKLFF